jgi:hypothetical protein
MTEGIRKTPPVARTGSAPGNSFATVDLVRGAALAELHAAVDWPSADAASTAPDQLAELLNARQLAAAAAGQDASFAA